MTKSPSEPSGLSALWRSLRRTLRWGGAGERLKGRAQGVGSAESLRRHSEVLRREVIEAVPGVHVAVGFGLANAIMIEGEGGVIIVDSMECEAAAREVKAAFAAINPAPVKALIYTHNHADHIFGGHVMAGEDRPEVISHATTPAHIQRIMSVMRPTIARRSVRQFGVLLDEADRLNCGIGPELRYKPGDAPSILWPTRTFEDRLEVTIAGVELVLLHAPGETPDQICVWLPGQRTLLSADNIYQAFPNLYAIRGTSYRDVMVWVRTLDMMRGLEAEHLVPSHTRPVHGRVEIDALLCRYRDAIQFVHDQTLRHLNDGLSVDEVVARVALPAHLAGDPWLLEHYGRVDWSVRSIAQGYLGWFGGDAARLDPLSDRERAARMGDLVGGVEGLMREASAAAERGDLRWSLELVGHALCLEPGHVEAQALRAEGLRRQASSETSANGRNYLLTQALEATGELEIPEPPPSVSARHIIGEMPTRMVMQALPVRLRAESCLDMDTRLSLRLTDTGESFTLHVRRGVAALSEAFDEEAEVRVTTTAVVWKEMLIGVRNPALTLASGGLGVEGGRQVLARLLLLFR